MSNHQQSSTLVASRRVRLSAGISLITVLSCVGFGLCKWIEPVRPWLDHLTIGLATLGMAFLIKRWVSHLQTETEDQVLHFHKDPGYWGACMVLTAGTVFTLVTLFDPLLDPPVQQVLARVKQSTPINPVVDVVEFPELKIGGVMLNGKRSSAVIGTRPVYLGEEVDGVRIILIFEDGVIAEKEGVRRVYYRNTTHGVVLSPEDVIYGIDSPTNGSGAKPVGRN